MVFPLLREIKRYAAITVTAFLGILSLGCEKSSLPLIAIANYGDHASLTETIRGLKDELARLGLEENKTIRIEVDHVNFEPSLIQQMLVKIQARKPAVMITMTTPVSQAAKKMIQHTPLVFSVITDPVKASLVTHPDQPHENVTGTSDKQDLKAFLGFARTLLPKAKKVGLLYAISEANDAALLEMMQHAAQQSGMELLAIPIEQGRDIPLRMQAFKGAVDFIYVGVSGPIQPALPVIAAQARRMRIPVFNADADAVKKHLALGSFSVDYHQVGVNTAGIVYRLLQGEKISSIPPVYPSVKDHKAFVSKVVAKDLGIRISETPENVTILE